MARTFHALLLDLLPRLRGYAVILTRNPSVADDLIQETALKVLRAEAQFAEGTDFAAWCFTIMRNTYLTEARRRQRLVPQTPDIPEQHLACEPDQEARVLTREILARIATLPPRDQNVLMAIARDGLSYQHSAIRLNCSVGTVKSRLWRARSRLQTLLNRDATPSAAVFPTASGAAVARDHRPLPMPGTGSTLRMEQPPRVT